MTATGVADALSLFLLLAGALLCLTSAIGLLRLPDVYSRMHAASKPQALGVLLMLVGLGLRLRSGGDIAMLVLVALFQMLTIPVSAHLLARAQYRQVERRSAPQPAAPEVPPARRPDAAGAGDPSADAADAADAADGAPTDPRGR